MPPEIQEMTRDELLTVVSSQYVQIQEQHVQIQEQEEKINFLTFEIQNLKKLIFGAKSERFVPAEHPQQTKLDFG